MDERLTDLLSELNQAPPDAGRDRAAAVERTAWLRMAPPNDVAALLRHVAAADSPPRPPADLLLASALAHVAARLRGPARSEPALLDADAVRDIGALYRRLPPESPARLSLLQLLAVRRSPASLAEFAGLIVAEPPGRANAAAVAFGPLFQFRDYDPAPLYPRLFDGLERLAVAPAILDLANFVTREGLMPRHPGTDCASQLIALLGGLVGRLGQLETAPPAADASLAAASQQVNDAVALAVSLCDALALIGDPAAVGKLYQAAELRHRRLRTEAAAALARLGEKTGREMLVALAAEPVSRLRVLAYATELGFLEEIDPQHQTAEARAEAELALWLAQPEQMGLPPSRCEPIDHRTQYWPGYDDPVECFLFRFTYDFGEFQFGNIGIAGPLTHAFGADLSDLPPDDIYAAFAGWHAEHEDIYEVDVARLGETSRVEVARLQRRLQDQGYAAIEPLTLASFFGDRLLVARAERDSHPGVAVVDQQQTFWLPLAANRRPPGPEEAYCIYKGRRLLRAFN